jgi:outer membrane receptor protein involved in Fe transport
LHLATGLVYRTASSSTGRYWLRGLPPGRYEITAEQFGLRTMTVRNVELAVGRTVEIDFALVTSAIELEPFTVEIGAPLIETSESQISYVVDREQIERLPEEARQFIELAKLVPGATDGTESTGGFPMFGTNGSSVGALNRQSLGVLVDGGNFTEGMFGDLSGSIPLLAIQEFEVIQSQYSAELGRAASGIINVVTRRGGNRLSVTGFGLYRHHALNARGVFEAEKPDFNRSHWGVAVGGPVSADRTYFMAALERRDQNDFSTVNTGGAFPEYEGTFKTPFTDNLLFARLDHRVNDAHELTLRYSGEVGEQLGNVGDIRALENGHKNTRDMHSGLLTHRWALGGTWLNEARLHVIGARGSQLRNAPPGPTLRYPSLWAGPNTGQGRTSTTRVELRNDLSWISAGAHRFQLGAHLSWLRNETQSQFFEHGAFFFAQDTASLPVRGQIAFADPAVSLDARNTQLAFYAQDDWTVAPGLTLNLGLRYDIETNGSNQGFISPFAGELPFVPTTPRPIDKDNVAPRIGIAWDPAGDGRTVLRGGFGIFYDALVAAPLLALERSSGVPLAQVFDPGTTNIDSLMIDPDTVPPTVWTSGDIETAMTRQYSLGVQHTLSGNVVLRLDGIFVQGRHLLLQRNLNPFPGGTPRFPGFSRAPQFLSEGRAEAKMLLFEVRKAFPRGWLNVGYTLADRKNTNDEFGSPLVPQTHVDSLDLDKEWGPAAWDERHRLVATGGIGLPLDVDLVGKVIYASARPFTAITGDDRGGNADLDRENDRPPGWGRNTRRGPDFFRADMGLAWSRLDWGGAYLGVTINVYNVFNTTNGVPSSVQNIIGQPLFGKPLAAYPPRQVEVGMRVAWQ